LKVTFQKLPGNPALGIVFFWSLTLPARAPGALRERLIPELYAAMGHSQRVIGHWHCNCAWSGGAEGGESGSDTIGLERSLVGAWRKAAGSSGGRGEARGMDSTTGEGTGP
jgi:hypothetical protein